MSKTDAAYMRAYRARKRAEKAGAIVDVINDLDRQGAGRGRNFAATRIAELEEEVRHLKEELAKRPPTVDVRGMTEVAPGEWEPRYNTRPFTPVPKKGK